MGRYRKPQAKGSPYITPQGFERLQVELRELWERRKQVTLVLSAAAAEGDRSENAEYIYRKKELREIDRRIRYLQKRLPDLRVAEQLPQDQDCVFFGAWVTLTKDSGERVKYRIVGPDEFDPHQGYISIDSPLARALLNKHRGDDVEVETPGGKLRYYIEAIRYV